MADYEGCQVRGEKKLVTEQRNRIEFVSLPMDIDTGTNVPCTGFVA